MSRALQQIICDGVIRPETVCHLVQEQEGWSEQNIAVRDRHCCVDIETGPFDSVFSSSEFYVFP